MAVACAFSIILVSITGSHALPSGETRRNRLPWLAFNLHLVSTSTCNGRLLQVAAAMPEALQAVAQRPPNLQLEQRL
jgi:hypothetical protein